MNLPVNKWTVAVAVTGAVWLALSRYKSQGHLDFVHAGVTFAVIVGTIALWAGLLVGRFL